MNYLLIVPLLLCSKAQQPVCGPYSAAANHADDIAGLPDNRPSTWGTAAANTHEFTFTPPPGYVTRILRVYGNFQGWERYPVQGVCAGVLWGFRSNADDTAPAYPAVSANAFMYVQNATCGQPFATPVDFDTHVGGLLPDNVLRSVVAVFMNDTGQAIHMEPSFTVVYQFERSGE